MLRAALKLLLWPVGISLFAAGAELLQGYLDFAEGESYGVWVMLFGMAAAPALATALSEMASSKFKLPAIEILMLVNLSTWALPMAFLLIGLYLVPEEALPITWSAGFLLAGAVWVVVIEQMAYRASPKNTPKRRECPMSTKARCMAKRTADRIKDITRADGMSERIKERSNGEKASAIVIELAVLTAVAVVEWLRYFSVISEPDLWLNLAVAAAGLLPTMTALFWYDIWKSIWRWLPGWLKACIRWLLRRSGG